MSLRPVCGDPCGRSAGKRQVRWAEGAPQGEPVLATFHVTDHRLDGQGRLLKGRETSLNLHLPIGQDRLDTGQRATLTAACTPGRGRGTLPPSPHSASQVGLQPAPRGRVRACHPPSLCSASSGRTRTDCSIAQANPEVSASPPGRGRAASGGCRSPRSLRRSPTGSRVWEPLPARRWGVGTESRAARLLPAPMAADLPGPRSQASRPPASTDTPLLERRGRDVSWGLRTAGVHLHQRAEPPSQESGVPTWPSR